MQINALGKTVRLKIIDIRASIFFIFPGISYGRKYCSLQNILFSQVVAFLSGRCLLVNQVFYRPRSKNV